MTIMNRTALTVIAAAILLSACAGRQERIEAQNRRPLRDIFPPPSMEQGAGDAATPSAKAPTAPSAAEPAPADQHTDVSIAPPTRAVEPEPAQRPADTAALKAPRDEGKPLFKEGSDTHVEEALGTGGGALAEEFGMNAPPPPEPAPGAGEPQAHGVDVEPQPARTAQAPAAPRAPGAQASGAAPTPQAPSAAPASQTPGAAPAPQSPSAAPAPQSAQSAAPQSGAPDAGATSAAAKAGDGPKRAPRIVFSTRPALLVPVYGEPRLKPIEGNALLRVENSPAIVLKGKSGNFYIPVYDGFVQSKKLSGPWTVTKSPPKVLADAKAKLIAAGQKDLFAAVPDAGGRTPSLALGAPRIVISSEPTALIVVDGQPGYQKVRNTRLSRLVNTPARVFRDDTSGMFYVQIGDDWYGAKTTDGPWKHMPLADLPADFAKVGR